MLPSASRSWIQVRQHGQRTEASTTISAHVTQTGHRHAGQSTSRSERSNWVGSDSDTTKSCRQRVDMAGIASQLGLLRYSCMRAIASSRLIAESLALALAKARDADGKKTHRSGLRRLAAILPEHERALAVRDVLRTQYAMNWPPLGGRGSRGSGDTARGVIGHHVDTWPASTINDASAGPVDSRLLSA